MTDDEIIAEAQANFLKANRDIGEHCVTGEVREIDGLLIKYTGVPADDQNAAFVTRPLGDPIGTISAAIDYFIERGLPYAILMLDGLDPTSERACLELGLSLQHTLPGMALAPLPDAMTPCPRELEIRKVTTDAEHDVHVDTDAAGFEGSLDHARRLFPATLYQTGASVEFTGFVDDAPVAISTLVKSGRTAGIYGIATVPAYRRRGYGEALTWRAIQEGAALGCEMANLTASSMGRPVYERMGFRVVAPFLIFGPPAKAG